MKAIIFDLYNTLIYTKDRRNPYVDFFTSLGLSRGEIRVWLDEILTNNYNNFNEIAQVVKPDKFIYTDKWDYDIEQEIKNTLPFDDTHYVLDNLSRKYDLFLLSNISTPYKQAFFNLGLNRYFKSVFFSCDIGYRKPQSEAFKIVMKETGYKPSQLLMIGDSMSSDFNGAINVGIKAILKDKPLIQIYNQIP